MGPVGRAFLLSLLLGSCSCSSSKKNNLRTVCGQPVHSGRISGGQDAAQGRWPWQVSLHFGLNRVCGGCLISDRWILTVAHCIQSTWIPWLYTVSMGSVTVNHPNGATNHHVSQIVFHPQTQDIDADIVLLKLVTTVTFTSSILPICLPNSTKQLNIPGSCWVTGWGRVDENEGIDYTSTLKEVEVPIINRQTCEFMYNSVSPLLPNFTPMIKKDMICAGDVSKGKDACKGDSGGPLSCNIDGVWTVIGLVSWGYRCGDDLPTVYTNVTYYQTWIEAIISRADVWRPTIWTYLTSCSLFYCSLWLF
ncbi:serine protease 48 [Phyllostomus discolor]|uniref:tryptase n=1 Tax=Phyllostomus discolor TaxID=89673 RepID=A0A833ZP25_9CHIR|nr:serine protease 48 [Phyllostomus discolor]